MKMSTESVHTVHRWMLRSARPVDLARWRFHFEGGSVRQVLEALSAYQNPDGGFAYALEADCWNPCSSPIQTWCATEILREIGVTEHDNTVISGILRYLDSGSDFDGEKWACEVASNNDAPHAFWWDWQEGRPCDYNPTATLAGFALRFAAPDSPLYPPVSDFAGCRLVLRRRGV